ncbi:MAG: glycosyltransferase family 39 protein [Vicinamibacteria bacterium]|nr:glycosyltransferase family 39 protein [Vicinamibacteria bacterium]
MIGLSLSDAWFVPLPPRDALPPPPISGVLLLRLSLVIQAAVLLWFGLTRSQLVPPGAGHHPRVGVRPEDDGDGPARRRAYGWLLACVTATGLGLRLISLDSDLWLDEVTPILDYGHASAWQVAISYISSNNHLLNTLLGKLSMAAFGEREWAIRLPAVIFGAATVPVLYWIARQAAPRHVSLAAALLLATSYHHIFFSQNARGYSGYLFFSLLASGWLVTGLRHGRTSDWGLYVAATVLDFATILISGFVFAAHVLVAGAAVLRVKYENGPWVPLLKRLLVVFTMTALLGFQLYALVLPQMYVYMRVVYSDPSTGFSPFSRELLAELARGLSSGFATGLLLGAVPLVAIAGAGYVVLWKRNWMLAAALTLPSILQAALLVGRGLTFSPRFFILVLPLAMLVGAQGIDCAAALGARLLGRDARVARRVTGVFVTLLTLISLASLPRYYSVPKQAYRSSLEYVESVRRPAGIVVVIHLAESGVRYYGQRDGLQNAQDYFYVRTVDALDSVLAEHVGRPTWLMITLPRALRIGVPDLDARIRRDWVVDRTFPGTVGDGDITVWREHVR